MIPLFLFGSVSEALSRAAEQPDGHEVSGRVIDEEDGSTLIGVNVSVKGTDIGTSTNVDGEFRLVTPSETDTLVFTYIGYQRTEVPIAGQSEIEVQMAPAVIEGEGVVVTGYQVQRREDITGSVSVARTQDITNRSSANVLQELQGRMPGVSVSFDGSPFDDAEVIIRGFSTLGDNAPLYVIDGVPSKTSAAQRINPSDIESIQVLRDAAAASIYGSRASNGVIVIETKRGVQDRFEVEYSGRLTTSGYSSRPQPLNSMERGEVLFKAGTNDGQRPENLPIYEYDYDWERIDGDLHFTLNEVIIPEFLDSDQNVRTANTNWFDEVTRTGQIQQHELAVSAGTDRSRGRFSLRYHTNDAILNHQNFERVTGRVNTEFNFFDGRLTVGENLSLSYQTGTPLPGGPLELTLTQQPTLPVYTEDGEFAGPVGAGMGDRQNPVRLLEHNRWDDQNSYQTYGNVFARFNVTDNLDFNTRVGFDWERDMNRSIHRTYRTGFLSSGTNTLSNYNSDLFEWTINSTLEYSQQFGAHDFNAIGGVEAIQNTFSFYSTLREDFAVESPEFMVENAGVGEQFVSGSGTGYSLQSFFTRLNYNYQDRYTASGTFRVDGSSRFGVDDRYGFFPSFSAGWRVSEESFFPDQDILTNLRFRAGYGVVGNQEIGNEARFTLFEPLYDPGIIGFAPGDATSYDIAGRGSGTLPSGIMRTQTGNPILRWEETAEINVGTNIGMFNDQLRIEFDAYYRETQDILIDPPYLGTIGDGGTVWYNGATVEVRGFDSSISFDDEIGDFRYNIRGTVSAFRDKVTELPEAVRFAYPGGAGEDILGRSPSSHFGYVADGIFQNQDEVDEHANQPGAGVGRIRYKDLNNDGEISDQDRTWLGTSIPDFEYGFGADLSYQNFDLSFFFHGLQGADVYNSMKMFTDFTSIWNETNWGQRTLNAWSPDNPDSDIPALTLSDTNNEERMSSYFIEDGSFLKLREVRLGYSFSESLIERIGATELTLFIQGENLITISSPDFTGPDPENPGNAFPYARNLMTGINVKF